MTLSRQQVLASQKRLLAWYGTNGRHALPWRQTKDPYEICVSEIMLQQTQVKTVLDRYYHTFIEKFPTLSALATAPLQDVMKAWEGLGYYSRAANLHRTAQLCPERLPSAVEGLLALPGIGRNTAHAIASFAFGVPVPVMEANVKRVLARIFGFKNLDEKQLWEKAELLMNRAHSFNHNQAMMDIGALVCTPRAPACPACPFRPICIAARHRPEDFPARKAKKLSPIRRQRILVIQDDQGKYYLPKRETRLLGGLHGFPQSEMAAEYYTLAGKCLPLTEATALGNVKHTYSHFTLLGSVSLLQVRKAPKTDEWYSRAAINALPLSNVDRQVLTLIDAHLSAATAR